MISTKILLPSLLSFLAVCQAGYGQHIEEIRTKLYPKFDPIKWRENYSIEDYVPVDYSKWDASPKAPEFEEAFQGYYTLEYFLSKRNREIRNELDEKGRTDFMNTHKKWVLQMHSKCNKVWKPDELGYSMMVLDYLYCVNLKTRQRVDSLGGGIPPNNKLDELAGIDRFKIGNDHSLYPDLVLEKENGKIFVTKDPLIITDSPGKVSVSFRDGKLALLQVNFSKCYCQSKLYDYLKGIYGKQTSSSYDQILAMGSYFWRGALVELTLYYDDEGNTATVVLKAVNKQ